MTMTMAPRDLANRMRSYRDSHKIDDGFSRETFQLPLDKARQKAWEIFDRYPRAANMTKVERWRRLSDNRIQTGPAFMSRHGWLRLVLSGLV
ncbi:MAG: hypothetical protein BGP05_14595 [Rhizobiales bacterium 62-47]|nr:MAG: hypothetical protein BGP05_14595 [Rhizobiales bacterium 62-47]